MKKTDEALAKAIEKAMDIAEKTGNFAIEQAPELLKEFYAWGLWSNIVMSIVAIVALILLFKASSKIIEEIEDEDVMIIYLVRLAFLIFPAALLICFLYDILFILIAPKLYLIHYFAK